MAAWWNTYWFPETAGLHLAVCRVFVALGYLVLFREDLSRHLMLVDPAGGGFIEPQVLMRAVTAIVPAQWFPTAGSITGLYWATLVGAGLTLIGLFTRMALPVFALGSCLLVTHRYSYGEQHHGEAFFCLFLVLLALAPCNRRWAVDAWFSRRDPDERTPWAFWPIRLMQILLAIGYFFAGFCKMYWSGLSWMNGYTLQHYLLQDGIRWDRPVGLWLAERHSLCVAMSVAAVAVELFFFVILFIPRLTPLFLVGAGTMHIMIFIAQKAPFFQWLVLYVVFLGIERTVRSTRPGDPVAA